MSSRSVRGDVISSSMASPAGWPGACCLLQACRSQHFDRWAETGPALWPRVTGVTETETAVTVAVRSAVTPFVATTGTQMSELTVNLSQPLGDRQIVESMTGPQRSIAHRQRASPRAKAPVLDECLASGERCEPMSLRWATAAVVGPLH